MDKIKRLVPLAAFCLYFLKISIFSASYVEAAILLILGGLAAFFEYKETDKKITAIEIKLEQISTELKLKSEEIEGLKSGVTSLKLSSGMRSMGATR